jgi:hypothetical protein
MLLRTIPDSFATQDYSRQLYSSEVVQTALLLKVFQTALFLKLF